MKTETHLERERAWADALIARMRESRDTGLGWVKPWSGLTTGHYNPVSDWVFQGGNAMGMTLHNLAYGTTSIYWIGKGQVKRKGWRIRKGAKLCPIQRPIPIPVEDEEDGTITIFRAAWMANGDDVEGFEPPELPEPKASSLGASELLEHLGRSGAKVLEGEGFSPSYAPVQDVIRMPPAGVFRSAEDHVSTLAHEHVHWTGHETRLKREQKGRFGSKEYAFEELVAEMGASFLAERFGVPDEGLQHTEYLAHWIELLEETPEVILKAARLASSGADYLQSVTV